MPFSASPKHPPSISRSGLRPEELHLLTGIPTSLLEGFAAGLYRPCTEERIILTDIGRILDHQLPTFCSLYMDKVRFRILRRIKTKAAVDDLLSNRDYGDYHAALLSLMEFHKDEVEQVISKMALANGYDPAKRKANPAD